MLTNSFETENIVLPDYGFVDPELEVFTAGEDSVFPEAQSLVEEVSSSSDDFLLGQTTAFESIDEDGGNGFDLLTDQLSEGGIIELIVEYDTSFIEPQIESQRQLEGLASDEPDSTDTIELKARLYQDVEDQVISDIPGIEVISSYSHLPLNFVEVSSTEELDELVSHPDVVQVYEDTFELLSDSSSESEPLKSGSITSTDLPSVDEDIDRPNLAQSLPQINQPTAEANGYIGSGTTVAVLDTGADPNAPGLGGRIVFSRDFAPDDGAFDDDNHGTNVSAITAAVAPGTDIAALDVFTLIPGFGQGAYTSDQIDAMNWSIANKSTYNIVAINMSLGGGQYFSPTTSDARYSVIQSAKSAGILTVAASGNDGWSNSMGVPAAIEGAISVGAVSTSDTVASFSNSANFLDVLAPGVSINAGGFNFSGTSMATPHVAGAVAVLAAADSTATPDDIVDSLKTTETSITDNRNGLSFPRLDLAAALDLTATPPPPSLDDNYEENDSRNNAYDFSNQEQTWLSSINGEGIANDDDWYEIQVNAGEERILVDLQFSDAAGDIDIQLTNSNGGVLVGSYSVTDNESIDYTVSSPGTYYLRVYPYSGSDNTYDLWWDDVSVSNSSVANDFDGDGRADIHWRSGNSNRIWEMGGTDTVDNKNTISGLSSAWVAQGNGDFDGDGDADILWRNGNANRVWEMENGSVLNQISIGGFNSAWDVTGIGDFDGDGDDDILWRNGNSNRGWEMQNLARVGNSAIGGFNSVWSVTGIGDFDADGDDDILWRNGNSNRVWEMQNLARVGNSAIGGFNSAWQVEDVEDYDGDGDDDILWRNGNSNRIWEMNNLSRTGINSIDGLNSAWTVVG
ncbi:MAG: S8 family serine peptidase [Microcoleaceae cyanobacterium]